MKSTLALPVAYDLAQFLIRGPRFNKIFARQFVKAAPGSRVLDIGCGTAAILQFLPNVEYVGFDMSEAYVGACQRRYGQRGRFYCQKVSEENLEDPSCYDVVLAIGVIHHLDDAQADRLFAMAYAALRVGGRLITLDGVYVDGQPWFARWLLDNDRGKFVRREEQYLRLANSHFATVNATITRSLFRIPYTNVVLECCK